MLISVLVALAVGVTMLLFVVEAQAATVHGPRHSSRMSVKALALGAEVRVSGHIPSSVIRRARSPRWRLVLEQRSRFGGHTSWRGRKVAKLARHRNGAFLLRWHRHLRRHHAGAAGVPLVVRVLLVAGHRVASKSSSAQVRAAGAPVTPGSCPSAKVIGVRGSGETVHDGGGYGPTVKSVVDWVRRLEPGSDAEYVNYDAIQVQWWDPVHYVASNYNRSVGTGISSLLRHISGFLQTCHTSRLYLVGHSQGAQVVGDTYLGWLSDAERARITGVALTGDPKFKGGQEGPVDVGSFDRSLNGVVARVSSNVHLWPSSDWSKVRSYCAGGDPVCSFKSVGQGAGCVLSRACPHKHYPDYEVTRGTSYTLAAAEFLVSIPSPSLPPKGGASQPTSPAAPVATPGAPGGGGNGGGTVSETPGGVTHTWTNYTNAGGYEGPSIPSNQTVQVACKLQGMRVADGNTWWYRIASSPWNGAYYASADAFYNNGATSGSLHGTPFVDGAVPDC